MISDHAYITDQRDLPGNVACLLITCQALFEQVACLGVLALIKMDVPQEVEGLGKTSLIWRMLPQGETFGEEVPGREIVALLPGERPGTQQRPCARRATGGRSRKGLRHPLATLGGQPTPEPEIPEGAGQPQPTVMVLVIVRSAGGPGECCANVPQLLLETIAPSL